MVTTPDAGSSPATPHPNALTQREEHERASWQLDAAPKPKRQKPPPRPRERRWTKDETKFANAQASRITPIQKSEEHFRHAHWKDKRARVRIALTRAATSRNTLEAFENCGSDCTVEYDKESQRYRLRANYCKSRHCEPCMKAKANLLAANLQKKVTDTPNGQFRFVTLTLKHSQTPLAEQIDRLNNCFKKLRNSKLWKQTQTGGAAIFECKYNQDTGEWHPHLHLVAQGFFVHQRDLAAEWYALTGDSFKVDIRVIKNARDASYYVAKYTSKGTNDAVWYNQHAAQEWIEAMKGRRTCATYGSWRGHKLLDHLPDTGDWQPIATLHSIMRAAENNDTWAVRLLDTLKADLQYNPHKPRKHTPTTLPIVAT